MGSQLGLGGYVAIAAVIWIVQTLYKGLTSPLRRVPGPFFSNFTRLPLKLATIGGRQLYFIHELHQRYGPVVRISPTEVSVASLDGFKEIHRVGKGFPKGEWYQKLSQNRAGVFHMRDSKAHAYRRKLFARAFSKSEIRSLWEPVIREKAQLTVSQIQAELKATGVCDVLKWATFFSTDVSGHLMFGESFEMLRLGKKTEYIRILESALKGAGIAVELPFLRAIAPYVPIKAFRGLFIPGASIAEYSQRAVTNGRKNSDSCRNIFSGLIAESEKGQSAITDADVAFEAGNLIIAGSDTTAVTLTYLIWAVLSRPALRSQLETELAGVNENYVEADLESLPLLNAVILETLRLYGAAPGALPRTVPAGGVTLSSHYLPSGTTVSTQNWTMHRDEKFFSDPESFDPSRWLPGDNEVSELAREAFAPFGAGARICLGIHIAWMELRLAVTEFFRRCENVQLAPSTTEESMKPVHYFLIAPSAHQCEVVLK
ncbi:sterigmatocystin biosynthesis P450 monooxygenase STCB [Penicillium alfredii]|uniref:Sterigmatocystin biosynthesis P450 monooxygenase STCB n=1 Tax=Penicillium alfredii TaxID=1506179 RepID=A0A9W9K417_9EURO|nr:sterigmatocystin biosynthesis P450 monooxygenase STCB [Penicillium alfredii]KAJ5092010.1 sterigmatocystin biosynthesis P450 monooxygenase STCB [Penicillium alfredii]